MEQLSQRKYAKSVGVSPSAVSKAIKAGHIKRGYNKKTKKIKVKIANKEWGNETREKHKHKIGPVEKPITELSPLMIAVTNYFNACEVLFKTIERELERSELHSRL